MNKRIQKWLKNHLVRDEYTEFGWQECHRYEFDENEIKEFTELIVRECMEQLNISNVPAPISLGLNLGRVAIKEHFGVEE